MKRWMIFVGLVVCLFVWSPVQSVQAAGPPSSGGLVVQAPESGIEFKVTNINSQENSITIGVPVMPVQLERENITNPQWQISASWAWTDGVKWHLVPEDDYKVETFFVQGHHIKAKIVLPKPGGSTGWYWLRIWGQDTKSKKWLWIDQSSKYCRDDLSRNPGYELLVNPSNNQYRHVLEAYDTRP